MMNSLNYKLKSLVLAATCFMGVGCLQAQVTIGSKDAPISGALLDLKQDGGTTKGLGLPRVKLTDTQNITVDIDGVTLTNAADHIGLTVYNTEVFGLDPVNCPGPYTWNGEEWKALIPKETKPETTMIDTDGNEYTARWFGYDPCDISVGAYWTVTSLYSAKNAMGTAFTAGMPRLNPAMSTTANAAIQIPVTGIPAGTIEPYGMSFSEVVATNRNVIGKSYKEFAAEYGLLYNLSMAQEACPAGWHLPSKAEWEYLISGQGGYELCTAKLRKAATWKAWYRAVASSGSAANPYQWGGAEDGDEQPVPSGFDAVPSGQSNDINGALGVFHFAQLAYFWSSDGTMHDVAAYYKDMLEGNFQTNPEQRYFSVRCVKDDPIP